MNENRVTYLCAGPRIFQEGEVLGREGCGFDVTELIEAIPFDGQDHSVECPQCRTVASVMRAPQGDTTHGI